MGRPPRRLFQAQYRRNPSRCHRTTVSGCIAITLSRQLATNREKAIQNKRSVLFGRARFTVRFNMTTCWRRARFSRASSRCDFSDEKSDATIARISANIMPVMVEPAGKNVNYINAIAFLGGTTPNSAFKSRISTLICSQKHFCLTPAPIHHMLLKAVNLR